MAPGPVAADTLAVIRATAVDPDTETWEDRSSLAERPEDEVVDLLQRRLCLADDRRAELEAAVARHGVPRGRSVVTVWWEGAPAALS